MSGRLLESSGRLLERRTSRRGLLARAGLVASAFAVAPLRYLLRPLDAWAVIRRPNDCPPSSLCGGDGYTEFCCTISGGRNSCPADTFVGGWWKCTRYRGNDLCGNQRVRYYVDCNVIPGRRGEPCQCGAGKCSNRHVYCTKFRYGQCNTQIKGTTPIACRVITCVNPPTIPELRCNATYLEDDNTCSHNAPCLDYSKARVAGKNPGA